MLIKDIMHSATILSPEKNILEIAKVMGEKNIGSILVKVSSSSYGIITERDIVTRVVAKGQDPTVVKARDVMTELQYTVDAQAEIEEASEIFNRQHIRRLPVVEKGEIVGMITTRDVARRRRSVDYQFTKKKYDSALSSKRWR